MKEIVAALINGIVTNDINQIISSIESRKKIRLLSRAEMQFMAACDLGKNWENLSKSKTLFLIGEDGKIILAQTN